MSLPRTADTQVQDPTLDADKVADLIEAANMGGVAVILLSAFKPLAWIGGQAVWMLQPFLDGVGGRGGTPLADLARLLESENGVDTVLRRLSRDHGQERASGEQ